uniref:Uncharacterized protein n=1 Tax=Panagrolaimus sp. ES5 TaxID=591445 RepID=A0AC34G3G9_9BILA
MIPAGKIMNMLAYNSQGPYTITSDVSTQKGFMSSPSFNGISGDQINPLYNIVSNDIMNLTLTVKSVDGTLTMQNGNSNKT